MIVEVKKGRMIVEIDSTALMPFDNSAEEENDLSSCDSCSSFDSILDAYLKKIDSKNRINARGQRIVRTRNNYTFHSKVNKSFNKRKNSNNDPLLSKFLMNNSSIIRSASLNVKTNEDKELELFASILFKSDSINNIEKRGYRVVKTKKRELKYDYESSKPKKCIEDVVALNTMKKAESVNDISSCNTRIAHALPKKNPLGQPIARCA